MPDLVKYALNDGTEVYFEAAEGSLVSLRGGGQPDVVDGGRLGDRLDQVAGAAQEVAQSLRSRLTPDEIKLEFGVKVAGEVNWWFFAKTQGESTLNVTLTWQGDRADR
jgi:hypothetical protein